MTGDATPGRTDLVDLLRARQVELGRSTREIAPECVDPEGPDRGSLWKRVTLQNLLNGMSIKVPDLPHLRALAAGFRLPFTRVQEAAAAQFFGLDVVKGEDPEVRAFVHDFLDMPREDREWMKAIMDTRRNVDRS